MFALKHDQFILFLKALQTYWAISLLKISFILLIIHKLFYQILIIHHLFWIYRILHIRVYTIIVINILKLKDQPSAHQSNPQSRADRHQTSKQIQYKNSIASPSKQRNDTMSKVHRGLHMILNNQVLIVLSSHSLMLP